jgi:nickel transport protein
MSRRQHFLSPPVLLATVLLLTGTESARAHRLEAEYTVLPGKRVQIESWFETGQSAKSAKVQVFRANGELLTEGRLDAKGIFVFSFTEAESLKVVVNAGLGHSCELHIPAAQLARSTAADGRTAPSPEAEGAVPRADRGSRDTFKDVLIGVGFLLAVAAFALSVRNARRLRELERRG